MNKKSSPLKEDEVSLIIPTLGKINFSNFRILISDLIKNDLINIHNYEIIIVFNQKYKNQFYKKLKKEYSKNNKIKIIHEPSIGIVKASNVGINCAKYNYIARQDDDDISYPLRIKKTLTYLKTNDYSLVFTKCKLRKNGKTYAWRKKMINPLKIQLLFYNPFVHATMIIKKEAIKKVNGYKFSQGAEDHELFIRLLLNGERFGVLDEYLYEYNLDLSIRGKGMNRFFQNYIRSMKLVLSNCLKKGLWFLGIIFFIPSTIFQTLVLIKNISLQILNYKDK